MSSSAIDRIRTLVRRERLLDTATRLIAVPSPTGNAGRVLDLLASDMARAGFAVRREIASHAPAPAVLARLDSGRPGRCLQFNGHLDTVHLPFVPPAIDGNFLRGSGACDMKGGTAAAVEALYALRDGGLIERGRVLFVAHDLHEAPWGFGQQLDDLIRRGEHGDAVLIPEPLNQHLPVLGRGCVTWKVTLRRAGAPVHEVMRPADEPNVILAGAALARRLGALHDQLQKSPETLAGRPSVFIGQLHAGEIYNQYPQECMLEGTRRWLPSADPTAVESEFRTLVEQCAREHRVNADVDWRFIRGAFELKAEDRFVQDFQAAHAAVAGQPLPVGPKMFVDDGNSFSSLGKIPAITHGPRAGGQHTVNEWVDIDDLVRVAVLYALTAVTYLNN